MISQFGEEAWKAEFQGSYSLYILKSCMAEEV